LIAVEDLKLKNQMTKSAKGNEIKHGKKVRQKAGLNRTILRASFYQFSPMLAYKQLLNDKLFVKVDPKNTSITCLECGNVDKANRPKQNIFKCTACCHETNPDYQASVHIEYRGLQSLGLGTSLVDLKHKAFRSASLEVAS
jgi:putative transposase